ncbi:MAG TPA: hypothetical protein VHW69_08700 [Rhizomicrobium sp.]|jgi:hypothetical protein|nr:hypothetical protein [Rhizomicrobium sp.]
MKRLWPLLLCAFPAPAQAQIDYGASGYIDLRLVSPADETSWLQGGLGKTRYGKGDSNFQFASAVGEGYALLTPEILAVTVLRIEPEQRTLVDALEAYIRYRPVSTSPWRWSVKGGAFFAPFSLENSELGWSSYWTITPSAINSWFGDELRTMGGEGTLDWRTDEGTLEFIAAGFGWNDPAGVMIADRGWALNDRPTGLLDHLRLPNDTLILFGDQPPGSAPIFKEYDGNAGWYAGLSWDDTSRWHLEIEHYDNEADPAAHHGGEFAWRTRFWNAGASWKFDEFTLLSQALTGDTEIDPFAGFTSITDFDSAYLLLGWERGDWRVALRGDWFRTRTHTTFGASPALSENGDALTAAVSWLPRDWVRLTGELLWVESKRDERALSNLDPEQNSAQLQLSARFYLE